MQKESLPDREKGSGQDSLHLLSRALFSPPGRPNPRSSRLRLWVEGGLRRPNHGLHIFSAGAIYFQASDHSPCRGMKPTVSTAFSWGSPHPLGVGCINIKAWSIFFIPPSKASRQTHKGPIDATWKLPKAPASSNPS